MNKNSLKLTKKLDTKEDEKKDSKMDPGLVAQKWAPKWSEMDQIFGKIQISISEIFLKTRKFGPLFTGRN